MTDKKKIKAMLDELQQEAKKLLALLKEHETEPIAWSALLEERLKKLQALCRALLSKETIH